MSNGFPQQPMQQMTMPGYGQPYQQPMMPQMGMQQPGMDANMQRYISDMRQKLDEYERRFSQPPQYQMQQQQPMVPQNQPQQQEPAQFVLTAVASMDEAQNHPPDISGKKQWFINKDTDEIYSKQFNVKTAGLEFHRYGIDDAPDAAQDGAEATQSENPKQDTPDTIKTLQAKIEGLEKKQQELEERLNESNGNDGKPHADASTENAAGVSAANADGKRGTKPKPNNRLGATEKAPTGTDAVRADS